MYNIINSALKYLVTLCMLTLVVPVMGQDKMLSGMILDIVTKDPIPAVSIKFIGATEGGTYGDKDGRYAIKFSPRFHSLQFSAIGYKTKTMSIDSLRKIDGVVLLDAEINGLDEVVITSTKKSKYSNRNNIAVEFIREVIDHLHDNNARRQGDFSYTEYEKLSMSLSIENNQVATSRLLKKYPFLNRKLDSAEYNGKSLVPVYIQEKSSRFSYRNHLLQDSTLLGTNQSRVDQYLDEDGFDQFLNKLYGRPDLYVNDVALGNRRFLSPISPAGPTFYKYYIVDTIKSTQPWQLKVRVSPRSKEDALFSGTLYFSLDERYALQHAELYVNGQSNINWVDDIRVTLSYAQNDAGKYFLDKSEMSLHLGIFKKGIGVFGKKTFVVSSFLRGTAAPPKDSIAKVPSPSTNWSKLRPEPLNTLEQTAFANVDSLKHSTSFRRSMALGSFLLSGYVGRGPVEIGPFTSFYSFNPVEGSRVKFGGRTTDVFSKRLFFDAYSAYGERDKRWKYGLTATVSLTEGSIYKFPVRSLSLSHSYDLQIPGQDLKFQSDDNFLLSFKRGVNDKMWYNKKWQLEYLHETQSHLSWRIGAGTQQLEPAGILTLEKPGSFGQKDTYLKTAEVFTELRWAPNETFFQGKRYRRPINNGFPVFTIRYTQGIKGLLGGSYDYQRIVGNVSKRFYFSQLGYTDVLLEGGAVFGTIPYPLLVIHRANQTYTNQLASYNLMNFMEFMSDRYAAINLQHSFNGFLFNKIPLIKKLSLREMISLKVLSGTLSNRSNPHFNRSLYLLPKGEGDRPLTYSLERTPYVEASIGIGNIFKVLRVDWVKRLSYLDHPGISTWGIRAKFSIDF